MGRPAFKINQEKPPLAQVKPARATEEFDVDDVLLYLAGRTEAAARCGWMNELRITAGPFSFLARFERDAAPQTCARFVAMLPYREHLIHVRWSGEACWIPLGTLDLGLGYENPTSYPAPGQVLLYPGGVSETEILLAYGAVRFASKAGQLAGNHFLTIVEGIDQLRPLGELTLRHGAQPIAFDPI